MTLKTIHIVESHDIFDAGVPYFGKREVDRFLCGLIAFNDHYTKDTPQLFRTAKMYKHCPDGGLDFWEKGYIPLVFYDSDISKPSDFCKGCRSAFYDLHGLMMSAEMWNEARGVNFDEDNSEG